MRLLFLLHLVFLTSPRLSLANEYGKPGEAIHLKIGYQPLYAEAWSALILKNKESVLKYLPPHSSVLFVSADKGSTIANKLIGKEIDFAYVGDAPSLVALSKVKANDIRIISVVGYSEDQCGILLIRNSSRKFETPELAVKSLADKDLAAPQGSCADSFLKQILKSTGTKPHSIVDLAPDEMEVMSELAKIEAIYVWEPMASKLEEAGIATRIASGANFSKTDIAVLISNHDLIEKRPDVVKAILLAEFESEEFLSAPLNRNKVLEIIAKELPNLKTKVLSHALFDKISKNEGGANYRIQFPFVLNDSVRASLNSQRIFLFSVGAVQSDKIRLDGIEDSIARSILQEKNIKSPIGIIK